MHLIGSGPSWPDVLAAITDDSERRDCLLMLADELRSDHGAALLRELATRPGGLCPEDLCARNEPDRWDWNSCNKPERFHHIPPQVIDRMSRTINEHGDDVGPWYRCYFSLSSCWQALLTALDTLDVPVEVSSTLTTATQGPS